MKTEVTERTLPFPPCSLFPSLRTPELSPRGVASEAAQVLQQIIEIAVVQPLRAVDRHQRLLVHRELRQVRLEKPLKALTRVHDLDREFVLVLLDPPNPFAVAGGQRHRLLAT